MYAGEGEMGRGCWCEDRRAEQGNNTYHLPALIIILGGLLALALGLPVDLDAVRVAVVLDPLPVLVCRRVSDAMVRWRMTTTNTRMMMKMRTG